jgi:hypothetical protein
MPRTFIGADPGTANYGLSVIRVSKPKNKPMKVDIVKCWMFPHAITNITMQAVKPPKSKRKKKTPHLMIAGFAAQMDDFIYAWKKVFDTYSDAVKVSMERFQTRGPKGKTIECVSMMNGMVALYARIRRMKSETMIASSWKNKLNKCLTATHNIHPSKDHKGRIIRPLDKIYLRFKKVLPPHIIDAIFINIQGAISNYGLQWKDVDLLYVIKQFRKLTYKTEMQDA